MSECKDVILMSKCTECPKKRGISEDNSVCFTAQLMLNLGFSFSIYLKIEIHMFVLSTQAFLSDIRELTNRFFKNLI